MGGLASGAANLISGNGVPEGQGAGVLISGAGAPVVSGAEFSGPPDPCLLVTV